jgi:hypothetical protein
MRIFEIFKEQQMIQLHIRIKKTASWISNASMKFIVCCFLYKDASLEIHLI